MLYSCNIKNVMSRIGRRLKARDNKFRCVEINEDSFFLLNFLSPVDINQGLPFEIVFYLNGEKFNKLCHNKQDDLLRTFVKQCCAATL